MSSLFTFQDAPVADTEAEPIVTLHCSDCGFLIVPQEVAQVLWERAGGAGVIEAGTEVKVTLAQFKIAAQTMAIVRERIEEGLV